MKRLILSLPNAATSNTRPRSGSCMVAAGVPSSRDDFKPALKEINRNQYLNRSFVRTMKFTLDKQRACFLCRRYKSNPNARAKLSHVELEVTKIQVAVE